MSRQNPGTAGHLLLPHPASPAPFVDRVQAAAIVFACGSLNVRFQLDAAMEKIVLPPVRMPGRADGLWRHTCFEVFVAGEGSGYHEFNLSPSRQWQACRFHGYRAGVPLERARARAPKMVIDTGAAGLTLDVVIGRGDLPAGRRLVLGLCAVLEALDGSLSHWALRHAPGRPDFHHPACFALEIEWPET